MTAVNLGADGGHPFVEISFCQLQSGGFHQRNHIGRREDLGSRAADALGGHVVRDGPGQGVFGWLFHVAFLRFF